MADYYPPQQLAQKLDLDESIIANLEATGALRPTIKNGRKFFSSRQAYLLEAAVRLARKSKIGLEEAVMKLEGRWIAQTSSRAE